MGARICGAEKERDRRSAAACWCGGLFCGRGGYRASREARRVFKISAPAFTREQFEEIIQQPDLFDGDALRDEWRGRVATFREAQSRRGRLHAAV